MDSKCAVCLLDLLCVNAACSAHTGGCCGQKRGKIQNCDWPFLSDVKNPTECVICEEDLSLHKSGIVGGRFCKKKTKPLCCNCGKKFGIGRCIEQSCSKCRERCPTVLEDSVRERMGGQEGGGVPTHLVVLLHGIDGYPTELFCVQKKLESYRNAQGQKTFITYAPDCYVGKTHDGIETIGHLVSGSVQEFIAVCDRVSPNALSHISFVCHSLGGLIGRFAVGKLADKDEAKQDCVAGLKAASYISTSSPHLGLDKAFGLPKLPSAITVPVSNLVAGKTGAEIFSHNDEEGVVRRLAREEEFVGGLRRFGSRRMYALEKGDHVIAPERSLLLPPSHFLSSSSSVLPSPSSPPSSSSPASSPAPPPELPGGMRVWELRERCEDKELTASWAAPLEALGWSKVLLRMPRIPWWLPIGHLKVTANQKDGFHADEEGNWVMQDVVNHLAALPL